MVIKLDQDEKLKLCNRKSTLLSNKSGNPRQMRRVTVMKVMNMR